jgi:hypothetical protein
LASFGRASLWHFREKVAEEGISAVVVEESTAFESLYVDHEPHCDVCPSQNRLFSLFFLEERRFSDD